MKKVLITAKVHPYLIDYLTERDYQVIYRPAISYDEVFQQIHSVLGLVVTTRMPIDKRILDNAVQLQWIARLGSGMEMIDVPYAIEKGIRCVSSPEGNCDAVGEQAIGMLISLFANILRSNLQLRGGVWKREENRGIEIKDKTIGIIGYGHTGHTFAKKLKGFECEVIAYDKYKKEFSDEYVKEVRMEDIFHRADVVSLHVPLTDETRYMVNQQFLESFTSGIYLINTSRGLVVNNADLIEQLKEGNKVMGACLDVLEIEKLEQMSLEEKAQFDYLLHHDRVVITPHIAGYTHEASFKMASGILKKLGI